MKKEISICWLRRDLRLEDNTALYYALKSGYPVLILFIFDRYILDKLSNKQDARVTFLHNTLEQLHADLQKNGSSIAILYGEPEKCWTAVLNEYRVRAVYTNHDYEPYARERDASLTEFLMTEGIDFRSFKDQVIFEKDEILKADGKPYTVFTPYFKQWKQKLNDHYIQSYSINKHLNNLLRLQPLPIPTLHDMGFTRSEQVFPERSFASKLNDYEQLRDFPGLDATTRIGLHLRFGTVSIRKAVQEALHHHAEKWLSELAWRDFYMMILWHFPHTSVKAFKPAYDKIEWRNCEEEFKAWCNGNTGYPIVDAGMRQLNQTGYMHNRVRMVAASFLTKHLLIDWRWGEAYFAEKLLDYEMASNIGGWQWAFGSGNDAAPYFRVFSPESQAKKFDPHFIYIDKWLPEYRQKKHVQQIVEHAFGRERALKAFKKALSQS